MHPVKAAVEPLKIDAIANAHNNALKTVDRIKAALEKANWDINIAAPRANSRTMSTFNYLAAQREHNLFSSVTKWRQSSMRSFNDPCYVDMQPERIAKFIKDAEETAAAQYDMFVMKLVGKIGDCLTASLEGNHVWGISRLTVTFADKPQEIWKTEQIYNCSKLGKWFPQWPSRKMGKRG